MGVQFRSELGQDRLESLIYPHVKQILLREVGGSDACLELGCGPGQYKLIIPGKHIGLDITAQNYRPDLPRSVDIVADAQSLPFKANCFDVVFVVASLLIIPDTEAVLRESHRVLRNGGKILIFDYNYRTTRRLRELDNNHRHIWTPWGLWIKVRRGGFQAKIVDLAGLGSQDARGDAKRWLLRPRLIKWFRLLRGHPRGWGSSWC